ncbi:hypothetical protein [Actinomadura decatromicini]|uniref:Uncharacterized protein n=1 Tax=Actinomadura decatromicini TaxID=2604572 RepID=A0A5D3FWC9_9ACTN|nr:hypothetical protein [Actinomadura decatromicini]TYK52338.1 hypothetical protein FXF68_00625 [Actinomadura decatromicini]
MTHWHILRLKFDSAKMSTENAIDVNLFFGWDRYPTTTAAHEAIREDILRQYPQAKQFAALGGTPMRFGVHYRINPDLFVTWQLAECSRRRCKKVRSSVEQQMHAFLAKNLGVAPTVTREQKST